MSNNDDCDCDFVVAVGEDNITKLVAKRFVCYISIVSRHTNIENRIE